MAELCKPKEELAPLIMPPVVDDSEDWTSNHVSKPRTRDACEVADRNIAALEQEILSNRSSSAPVARATWNRTSAPKWMDRVQERLRLNQVEQAALRRNGFAVLAGRPLDSYASAYHDVFQTELPVYITADSIFHAVFQSNDTLIANVETKTLAPLLFDTLRAMHCALPAALGAYPAEVASDVDVYLSVALALLKQGEPHGFLHTEDESTELVRLATEASKLTEVTLFGRARVIDFTQFAPRGHYTITNFIDVPGMPLEAYFRASMWLSRLEMNLVSRSCRSSHPGATTDPSETPREEVVALALTDLAERASVIENLNRLDRAFRLFAGLREDISFPQLLELRAKANIKDLRDPLTPEKLRKAIGDGYRRTARLHYMPQGTKELPAITTMLGPRVVDDVAVSRRLVHDEIRGRYMVHAADIAYVLGHDRAKNYLGEDRKEFPALDAQLEQARAEMQQSKLRTTGMYGAWLSSILRLADPPGPLMPSFMEGVAFQDLRMNTAIVAFGQLRHNYVLIAGQGYDVYGCEIPDGYVEPTLGAYEGLIEYAHKAAVAMAELDPKGASGTAAYFARFERVLSVLRAIVVDELNGRELTEAERRYLAMVAEHIPAHNVDSGGPPKYTGWYFDLFPARDHDTKSSGAFIADWYTSTNLQKVAYIGASAPRLGLFVVDTGGPARVMVGPVARGYEHIEAIDHRRSDLEATKAGVGTSPWEKSYTAPAEPAPPLAVRMLNEDPANFQLEVRSTKHLNGVTIELLNHHGVAIAQLTRNVDQKPAIWRFPIPIKNAKPVARNSWSAVPWGHQAGVEGVHVRVGEYHVIKGASDYRGLRDFGLGAMHTEEEEQ